MYIPTHFEETRIEVMHELMRGSPLATVVTLTSDGLAANHIPLYFAETPTPLGALQGHVARANPIWHDFAADVETLAIFQGPQTYISPSWYATKQDTGRVVPTWNYIVVHAYGKLRVIEDPAWLCAQLDKLTDHSEAGFVEPWRVADAPAEFTEKLLSAIVGIELVISRLEGKWKASQNQPAANQASAAAVLQAQGNETAAQMAAHITARAKAAR
jgi:transcriptional regulator